MKKVEKMVYLVAVKMEDYLVRFLVVMSVVLTVLGKVVKLASDSVAEKVENLAV